MLPILSIAQENCNNGIDDDSDGLIDLNDDECDCQIVQVESLIPNPSFEDYTCCPSDFSQLNCAVDWVQASDGSTDYIHQCGWLSFPSPPIPFPDGNGCIGFITGTTSSGTIESLYKEYTGACLLAPMRPGSIYNLRFYLGFDTDSRSPSLNISVYGSTSCTNLPFIPNNPLELAFDCPTEYPGWVELESELVQNLPRSWQEVNMVIQPTETINALVIGSSCVGTTDSYYFLDDLMINDRRTFDFELIDDLPPCHPDYTLEVSFIPGVAYQWYKDGIALQGENIQKLSTMYGDGLYQLKLETPTECRVSEYVFEQDTSVRDLVVELCAGEEYELGNETFTEQGEYTVFVDTEEGCVEEVHLELTVNEIIETEVDLVLFPGETVTYNGQEFSEEGRYRITVPNINGCENIEHINVRYGTIHVPSAFSPDQNDMNDAFRVLGSDFDIVSYQFTVYNRWGNKVFEGQEWDGFSEQRDQLQGVYLYILDVELVNDQRLQKRGTITLVK